LGGDGIRARKSIQFRKRPSGGSSVENTSIERRFKIGEAANLVGVEPYVLRFWETQFSCIRPRQSRSRHRFYTQSDIETLIYVKHLLHTEGYTIAGARRFIRERGLDGSKNPLAGTPRAGSGGRRKEHLRAPMRSSNNDTSASATKNGVDLALREIREDLRALHKLLETR
jgi:DNA-binding transcriptional MerR regulator